jgi:hypothetical protein
MTDYSLHLRVKFFPPLPWEYNDLAYEALDALNSGDRHALVVIPDDLNPKPRTTFMQPDGTLTVRAIDLVYALRLDSELIDENL